MNINEARKKYHTSDMWCECTRIEESVCTEIIKTEYADIYRGESKNGGKHVTVRTSDICYMNESEIDKINDNNSK